MAIVRKWLLLLVYPKQLLNIFAFCPYLIKKSLPFEFLQKHTSPLCIPGRRDEKDLLLSFQVVSIGNKHLQCHLDIDTGNSREGTWESSGTLEMLQLNSHPLSTLHCAKPP